VIRGARLRSADDAGHGRGIDGSRLVDPRIAQSHGCPRSGQDHYDGCESLINSPHRGRKGKQAGTRELGFSPLPYIAVYRVKESPVEILHIWHDAQNRR